MALLIKTAQDIESSATDIKLPRMSNLKLCSFMNGSLGKACRNLAPGQNDMTYVGAPVINDSYIGIHSYNNYFQTDIVESETCTLLSVARLTSSPATNSATRPMIISTLENSGLINKFGVNQFLNSASTTGSAEVTPLTSTVRYWSGATTITTTDWHFHYTIINTSSVTHGSKTAGTPQTDTLPSDGSGVSSTRYVSTRTFRVGSSYMSSYAGTADIAFAAIYDSALSDADVIALYEFIDPIMAARGITI